MGFEIPKTDEFPETLPGEENNFQLPDEDDPYIHNDFFNKEFLTVEEALDFINKLSGMVLLDRRCRRSQKKTS